MQTVLVMSCSSAAVLILTLSYLARAARERSMSAVGQAIFAH